uniref:Mitochondrial ribosomal protein S18A n=1 Tax=Acrobeloides nanus TaxID=290746 RepID=A0A914ENL5_9BILA
MAVKAKRVEERVDGNVTYVSLEDVPEPSNVKYFKKQNEKMCTLCTCDVPVEITYRDILILEQFMREDGTVLPKKLTGLCKKQQMHIERCIMQAHWSGLFPDKTRPDFDRAGYKRFNRHWKDDLDIYKLKLKEEPGIWYYIKRYNPKAKEYVPRKKE